MNQEAGCSGRWVAPVCPLPSAKTCAMRQDTRGPEPRSHPGAMPPGLIILLASPGPLVSACPNSSPLHHVAPPGAVFPPTLFLFYRLALETAQFPPKWILGEHVCLVFGTKDKFTFLISCEFLSSQRPRSCPFSAPQFTASIQSRQ